MQRQMRYEEFDFVLFDPKKHGDKINRMHSVSMYFRNGLIWAPGALVKSIDKFGREQHRVEGELVWVSKVMDQCFRTPREPQDLADCTSMALLWLRDSNTSSSACSSKRVRGSRSRLMIWSGHQRLLPSWPGTDVRPRPAADVSSKKLTF
jgi:hypothetical protein